MANSTTHDGAPQVPEGSPNPVAPVSRGGPFSGPVGVVISIALLAVAGYLAYTRVFVHPPIEAPDTTPVMYICAETGKTFPHVRKSGEQSPVLSPHSGKNTGYMAEKCYWTKDGKIKDTPTYVLLNEATGKPGPTWCPDCDREVIPHNPRPKRGEATDIIVPPARTESLSPIPATQPAG